MGLLKITDKGKMGNIYRGPNELLTIQWENGGKPTYYAFGFDKIVKQVDKSYFAISTIGDDYSKIEKQIPLNIENYQSTRDENGNIYLCTFQEGIIHGFDANYEKFLEWSADEVSGGHAIYHIAYQYPDFLWLAFPTGQTVTQVSISEKKETFKIGSYSWKAGEDYEPLSYPESLCVTKNCLYIPNMGNKKLFRLDLLTKEMELLNTFEERIWQYDETDIGTFIVTDTGIYELAQKWPNL